MFASNNLSAADVAAVTGGNRNNGFGDGDGWWIILLALLFGWGRNGAFGGGYGSGSGLHGSEPERLLRLPAELLSVLRLLSHGKKV